jgi:8-oxo-dGTP pyrophosphatase MutT (NUDIX family)
MVAAGILPISIYKNKLYFLFGKENPMENSCPGWSDFCGGVEKGETIFQTALREGSEELSGFLGDEKQLRRKINAVGGPYKINNGDYHIFIFLIEHDQNLIEYYNNSHRFLWDRMDKKTLNDSKLFEKIEIKWFDKQTMKNERSSFRSFYREIVDLLLEHHDEIKKYAVGK